MHPLHSFNLLTSNKYPIIKLKDKCPTNTSKIWDQYSSRISPTNHLELTPLPIDKAPTIKIATPLLIIKTLRLLHLRLINTQ